MRLAALVCALALLVGAVVIPKLYWDYKPISMECADMEHALLVLDIVRTSMRRTAGPLCMPGEAECIAEAWMYFEADELHGFIEGMHEVACQSL